MYLAIIIILVAGGVMFYPAYADFAIILSDTCITMIQNNITSFCPTYEEINLLFPDTSNQRISGAFVNSDGYYHRDTKALRNHYNFYKYDEIPTTWIDPPGDVAQKVSKIIITPNDFTYKIKHQVLTNASYVVGENRYVSSTCSYIIISAKNYYFLLGDSVKYLLSGCDPNETYFDEVKIRAWEATKHDITTSYKYKLDKWYKESKEAAKSYLIGK